MYACKESIILVDFGNTSIFQYFDIVHYFGFPILYKYQLRTSIFCVKYVAIVIFVILQISVFFFVSMDVKFERMSNLDMF